MGQFVPRNSELMRLARKLRRDGTPEERHLWYDFLRTYPVRFRRQRTIGPYIADFYCPRAKLVIELDGFQHYDPAAMAHDQTRTRCLEDRGLTVLRFTNTEVKGSFAAVCTAIDHAVKEAIC